MLDTTLGRICAYACMFAFCVACWAGVIIAVRSLFS